mgnify:CR=1 FL=1
MTDLENVLAGARPTAVPDGFDTSRMRGAIAERLFDTPAQPLRIGRFVALETIGHGAMGVVLSAYDPQLDRRVAVKVLREVSANESDRQRLLDEAKALARLNHPNVVTVYEAGFDDGRFFVAMEHVDGGTLQDVCRSMSAGGRHRGRLVELFRDAARGLVAAHDAGLVHRDIKPTNMLVDSDGRLRLADFGLALTGACVTEDGRNRTETSGSSGELIRSRGTEVAGTPAYMAPEQFEGRADARSDQFGLCASFWEVLYGRPPYAGRDFTETYANAIDGALQPTPPDVEVPRWLRRLLLRGLSPNPGDRYPKVADMLRELEARHRGRRRGRWTVALTLGVSAGLLALVWPRTDDDATSVCAAGVDARAPDWGDDRRSAMQAAFAATGLRFADGVFSSVAPHLDQWHARWREAATNACRQRVVADSTTRVQAEAREACLTRAAAAFTATVDALLRADREVMREAAIAVRTLPEPAQCETRGVERILAKADPNLAELALELTEAKVDGRLRRAERAQQRLEALRERLDDDGAGLRAYVHVELAVLAFARGEYEQAREIATATLYDAELSGDTEAQIQGWRLMASASAKLGETEAASFQLSRTDSLVRRDDVSEPVRARAQWAVASTLKSLSRNVEAIERFEQAKAIYDARWPNYPMLGTLLCEYSEALFHTDHLERAMAMATRCRDLEMEIRGPRDPNVAISWLMLAQYRIFAGLPEDGVAAADEALAILDENPWFSPTRRVLGLLKRGQARTFQRRFDEAIADYQRALTLAREIEGPDSALSVSILNELALAMKTTERHDEAVEMLREAVAIADRQPRVELAPRGSARLNLATSLAHRGLCDEALEHLGKVRVLLDAHRPPKVTASATYWTTVSSIERACSRLGEARAAMDRALETLETAVISPLVGGRALAEHAMLVADELGPTAAAAAVERAQHALREAGPGGAPDLAKLDAWAAEYLR